MQYALFWGKQVADSRTCHFVRPDNGERSVVRDILRNSVKKSQKRLRSPVQAVYTLTRVHDCIHRTVRAKSTTCAGRVRDTHGRQRGEKTDSGTDDTGNDIGTARLTHKTP